MACIRKRRGKHVVDYRDSAGIRRWITCETREEAKQVLAAKLTETRQATQPMVDPNITVAEYAPRWLDFSAVQTKQRTQELYRSLLANHILPALGTREIRKLTHDTVTTFLVGKLKDGAARSSVASLFSVFRTMLQRAKRDGVIVSNPCEGLGRELRLGGKRDREEQKALDRDQVKTFLSAIEESHRYPLFLFLARTGARLGEALGLQWQDVDFQKGEIKLVRQITRRRLETLKSGHSRTVDMSDQLSAVLSRHLVAMKEETLRRG